MAAPSPITHISDTARWVAMYRALESERPDALFHDPYARRLAGAEGEQILDRMPGGHDMAWPMVTRTAVFDELLGQTLRDPGLDAVLNLAAGLDARPWRLPLPSTLRWSDIDLPAILSHKAAVLQGTPTACHYEAVPLDLTDRPQRRDVFAARAPRGRRALAMSEGLLVYLAPEEVAALADDLHAAPGVRYWLLDLASPALLQMIRKRWGGTVGAGGAQFRFGPAEGTAFFAPHGWREAAYVSTWEASRRLKRQMRLAWLWNLLAAFAPPRRREQFRRFSGIVLLERQ